MTTQVKIDDTGVWPPVEAGSDPELARRWLSDAAFSLWAVQAGGLSREQVLSARGEEPLAEALIMRGDLTLEQAMEVLEPAVDVTCAACASTYPLGRGLCDLVGRLRCPRCAGALVAPEGEPRTIGRFQVARVLGRGGAGSVYEARSERGEAVALKVLKGLEEDEVARARFERERRLYERIDHENVVRVLDSGVDEGSGSPYLALELVRGADLWRLVDARPDRRLAVDEACFVLAACAAGLRHLHEVGVLHRDLKPSNVLVTGTGTVKLADLGLAYSSDVSRRLTAQGEVLGTPQYVAPEVVKGAEWTAASDVYSLGSCAFRLLAGQPAFPGRTVVEVLQSQLEVVPPPLASVRPDVPGALSTLVARMLQKDPAARPALEETRAALEALGPVGRAEVAARWGPELARLSAEAGAGPVHEPTLQAGQTFQGYRLEEELGRGGMGVVYRAYHLKLKKRVALKVLLAGALATDAERKRFLREAEAAAALQHPAIVPVLDAGEHDGTYYLTLEYVEGQPLGRWYQAHPDLTGLLRLFLELCDGVHHAHSRGVVHRDLKPDNVLVDADGHPHILDFGIAKRVDRADEDAAALTTEGDIIGTLRYMPPEQAAGRAHLVDVRSDVYALGSVLYELVTLGITPFRGGVHELLQQILFEEPRAPSEARRERQVPWELDAICLKTLEKDRDERYQSALELRRDVERFLDGRPIAARQAHLGYRLRKLVARNRRRLAAAAGVVAVLVAVALAWVQERARAERERQASLLAAARDGWAAWGQRDFQRAAVAFLSGAGSARGDDALPLPDADAAALPEDVRRDLAEDERARPRVTRDRLTAWGRMAQARIRSQQANERLDAALDAMARGDLEAATNEVMAARLLSPEDQDGGRLSGALVERWAARAGEALQAFEGRAAGAEAERLADLKAARAALGQARALAPEDRRVVDGFVAVQLGEKRVEDERAQREALRQAEARVAEAAALEAEAERAPGPGAADKLRQARVRLMAALERRPGLDAAREGLTRIALRLGGLALDADALDVAELELSHARVYGARRAEVDGLEERLRAQGRQARAFAALRRDGDAAFTRGALAPARAAYDLALAEREEPAVRRRRDLCDALLEAEAARARGAAEAERAALARAAGLDEQPERFAADLARLDAQLYGEALARAEAAYREAQARGAGWQEVVAAYERALRFRPDGDDAWVGRADAFAERDRPADMVLVSVPLRLLARGPAAARVGPREVKRFYVDRLEVSAADFARFVADGGYERRALWSDEGWAEARAGGRPWGGAAPPAGTEALPVVSVTAHEAAAYARWRGRRLPTEREWVLAACFDPASGRERRFPWGDEAPGQDALRAFRTLRACGASRADTSPSGAMDLAFNVAEWTWEDGAGAVDPTGRGPSPVVRGLSAGFFPHDLEAGPLDWRRAPGGGLRHPFVGFRCALDVPAPPPLERP